MPVTPADLWKLLQESRLLTPQRLEQVEAAFSRSTFAGIQVSGKPLAEWLVRQGVLTQYQATLLLNGRAGPFFYGDYLVQDRKRGGRLAGTFSAVHVHGRYRVLIKFVGQQIAQDPRQWSNARQYVHQAAAVDHPQLQRIYALEERSGYKYLVLENLVGQALDAHLAEQERLPTAEACRIVRLAAMGLTELHDRRQVHGDVRPENLWLEAGGNVKLMRDSVLPPLVPDLTRPGISDSQMAQADYVAPELAHPGTRLSSATDLYALGCTLYQLLTGEVPFSGGNVGSKLQRHAVEPVASLDRFGVPAVLADIVVRMMTKDPGSRMPSATVAVEQLAPLVDDSPPAVSPPPPPSTQAAFHQASRGPATPPLASPPIAVASPQPPAVVSVPPLLPAAEPPTGDETTPAPIATPTVAPHSTGESESLPPPVTPAVAAESKKISSPARRRPHRNRRKRAVTLSSFAAALLLIVLVCLLASPDARRRIFLQDEFEQPAPVESNTGAASGIGKASQVTVARGPISVSDLYEVWEDDGEMLWMTPTSGGPIQLAHVPPGAQLVLVLRPHDLVNSESGNQVLRALGPEIEELRRRWVAACGFTFEQIESLVISLRDAGQDLPRPACVVTLTEPPAEDELLRAWGNPDRVAAGDAFYQSSGGWSFYVPDPTDTRRFVMGTADDVKEVMKLGKSPPVLRREMAQLLQESDDQRHLSLIFAPGFLYNSLFRDGREYYFGDAGKVRRPLEWLLAEQVKACMISMQFHNPFYLELRGSGHVSRDSLALAEGLRSRLREVPDRIEAHFEKIYPSPYWRRVALRIPAMVRFIASRLRVGVEDDQAVVNVVLPQSAAHNLAFAGQMLLMGELTGGVVDKPPPPPQGPQTLEELLDARFNLSFDQKSLEFVMRDFAADIRETYPSLPFPFDIAIIGTDLQLNGITRNQQIADFKVENETVSQILTKLVRRANPITTVTDPSELDQKLIWVIGPAPDDPNKQVLLITTRDAAKLNNYSLPLAFQPK